MIKRPNSKWDNYKEAYTNNQVILGRNSKCFGHEKPFLAKLKVQGLEELLDIFQIPEEQNILRARIISDETC